MPTLGVQLSAAIAWLGIVALLAAVLKQVMKTNNEIVRKAVHIGTGNVILIAWWLQIPGWIGMSASVVFSIVALLSYRFPILPSINTVGRKSFGTFFYAISIGILIACFWETRPYYAALGILVMTWGDGLAALVGQRWGKHRYQLWGIEKSWEGSLAMTATSYLISSLIFLAVQGNHWQSWLIPVAIALVATTLEACSNFGIDNLTVPVGSAAIAFWLNQLAWSRPIVEAVSTTLGSSS